MPPMLYRQVTQESKTLFKPNPCGSRSERAGVFARAARAAAGNVQGAKVRRTPKRNNPSTHTSDLTAADELGCPHFEQCSGCSINHQLQDPPVVQEARAFFASREFNDFQTVSGAVHGWRCRAKLAVRGRAGDPQIGLFQLGSHDIVPIPECRTHHPRINQAAQLIKQVTAALHITPYAESQQRQHSNGSRSPRQSHSGSSSSRAGSGYLRYLQLTVLPSQPGGRAEDDPQAQLQVVLVWAAPDASHPSVADARRLAAALWSQGGPKQVSQLAALRQRAEAAAPAAATNSRASRSSRSSIKTVQNGPSNRKQPQLQQQQQSVVNAGAVYNKQQTAATDVPPLLHSVWINFQAADDSNAILGMEWMLCHGEQWGWQDFGGVSVAIAPGSFVQANYGAMQKCLSAIAAATPQGSSVVEYYAGCGVIGLALAAAGVAKKVVCVEVNPESKKAFDITKAQLAKSNQAAAQAVSHHVASAEDHQQLQQLLVNSDASVLVVDPPRKGLDQPLLQLLTAQGAEQSRQNHAGSPSGDKLGNESSTAVLSASVPQIKQLLYLSCGFKALKSDTDALLAAGWKLSSCQAYFFVPGTDSVETLAVFDR